MKSDSPREGECHNNADRYVSLKTRTVNQSVAGLCSTMLWRRCSARAHISASHRILSWSGQTDDYSTPRRLRHQRYPFLRHEGPESEFDAIIAAGYTQLDYPV